jgi:hypothetical protein
LRGLDHLGHGESLAGTGDAQKHLIALSVTDAKDELGDCLGLIAPGLVIGDDPQAATAFALLGTGWAMRCEMPKLDELGAKMLQSLAGLREICTGVGALAQGWKGRRL